MNKHTPGPWNRGIAQFVYQGERWDPNGRQRLIATCEPSTRTQSDWEETWANARLIAAAPDLLQAIQDLLTMPDFDGTQPTSETRRNAKRAARAAISKATGEKS